MSCAGGWAMMFPLKTVDSATPSRSPSTAPLRLFFDWSTPRRRPALRARLRFVSYFFLGRVVVGGTVVEGDSSAFVTCVSNWRAFSAHWPLDAFDRYVCRSVCDPAYCCKAA